MSKGQGEKLYGNKRRNDNERILRSIIIDFRRELIGGTENHYYDNPEDFIEGKDYDPKN